MVKKKRSKERIPGLQVRNEGFSEGKKAQWVTGGAGSKPIVVVIIIVIIIIIGWLNNADIPVGNKRGDTFLTIIVSSRMTPQNSAQFQMLRAFFTCVAV